MKLENGRITFFHKTKTFRQVKKLKSILIFNYVILISISIYFIISHLIKKNKTITDILFVLIVFLAAMEFSLIIAINIYPYLTGIYYISAVITVIPAAVFIIMICLTLLFPAENIGRFKLLIFFLLVIIIINIISVFILKTAGTIEIDQSLSVTRNRAALIQAGLILLSVIIVPFPLIIKMRYTSFRRIRTTITYFLSGLIVSYILFIALYTAGLNYYSMPILTNPLIPLPVLLILVFTSHLIFNLKKNDFQKFYKLIGGYTLAFIIFFIPVYFFIELYDSYSQIQKGGVYIKSSVIFLYLVVSYRLINPYIDKLRTGKLQDLLHAINKTLMPVNELKKFSDMDTFWAYITNDNFQNLKYTLGIQSAYFMLINRKENIFQFTYGYGPELDFQSIDGSSEIASYLISHEGVFEKSFLISNTSIKKINRELLDFFDNNGIEISMVFKNMSDNIIGFLLLGKIEGNKSYTSDHLAALEIFRIKIQNLLITGLILDEVTAEQVAEHDKIVVSTVKKRIIPEELSSIPGIRISSFNINNSSYGGDYFDSVKIASDKTALFIADTSYSGIDSALAGMELFSILHSRTLVFNSPEKILNTMNQVIKTSRMTSSFTKGSCLIIASDGNYSFANAAHNHLLIYEPGKENFIEIETDDIALGIEMEHRYSFTTGKLKEGAIGILYSDGLFSTADDNDENFSIDKLQEKIVKHSRETPAVLAREVYSAYASSEGVKEQLKDVTFIVFKKVKIDNEQH